MKHLSREQMKKIMGGKHASCVVGGSIVGYSGGGVAGGCRVDIMFCSSDCKCTTVCDLKAEDDLCR